MSRPSRDRGELALVLHSHMPYVEGFGTWPFGEEWLFEATATTYLPLVELLERWATAGEQDVATIGVSPVLADQLVLAEVGERFMAFMRGTRADTHREDIEALELAGENDPADALRRSACKYERAADLFERLGGDLVGALRRLRDAGTIELWASAATHAVLPLVATEAGIRLQLAAGVDSHRDRFGRFGGGFWLPECAYREGLDAQLGRAGVRCFCVDQTASGDELDQLEPVATPGGPVAVPIDWRTISLVWDRRGYPADPVYRDYHALTGNGLRPYANGGGAYVAGEGLARAGEHAREFVARVIERLDAYQAARGRPGLVVCALDTELLGHWWHEGPAWLASVVEEARAAGLALTTLPEALERHPPRERALCESSWGSRKDLHTWDSPAVADLVWPARSAELRLLAALDAAVLRPAARRAARRAARELLALQSSDWAFMATRELAGDYPRQRVRGHSAAFEQALAVVERAVQDFPDMSERGDGGRRERRGVGARVGGLAPGLDLSALLEPASAWGRQSFDGSP